MRPAVRGTPAAPCDSEPPQCNYPPQAPSPAPGDSPPSPAPPPPFYPCDGECVAIVVGWVAVIAGVCIGVALGYKFFAPRVGAKARLSTHAGTVEITPMGAGSVAGVEHRGDFA